MASGENGTMFDDFGADGDCMKISSSHDMMAQKLIYQWSVKLANDPSTVNTTEEPQPAPNGLTKIWRANRLPLLVFLVSRLGLFLIVYLGLISIPLQNVVPGQWQASPDNLLLDGWSRWDSGWYTDIAVHGYSSAAKTDEELKGQENIVFFPGYPLLLRAGMLLFGDVFLGGIILSNLCFLVALVFLFHLVQEDFGTDIAERTVILLSVFPFAFYFSAVYSESLFLMAAVGAFYFGKRGIWSAAAVMSLVAAATRPHGIVVPFSLLILYFERIHFRWSSVRANILWLPVGFAGFAGYFVFLWARFGYTPLDYITIDLRGWQQERFFSNLAVAMSHIRIDQLLSGDYPALNCLHALVGVLSLVLALFIIKRINVAYGIWTLVSVLIGMTNMDAVGRYLAVIFPLFIAMALLLKKESAFWAVIYISTLLLALFAILFSHWY
jgi:dolichyl-phosphate-mannose-protein mannosyltransferase